jgi:hypothetical protein
MYTIQFVDAKSKVVISESMVEEEQKAKDMVTRFENTGGQECVLFRPDRIVYKATYFTNTTKGKLHKIYFKVQEQLNPEDYIK